MKRCDPQRDCYRINVSRRIEPRVEVTQRGRSRTYEIDAVSYEGFVYCATVNEGALLVRRNGHVVVSGNSPFEHVAWAEGDPNLRSGNFVGFTQYRKAFEQEHIG